MGVSSAENTLEKTTKLDDFSTGFFSVCDTCDSKKTTLLLEGARTYAHIRARGLEVDKQSVDTSIQRYEKAENREGKKRKGKSVVKYRYCYVEKAKSLVCKIKMLLFRDFFTLWGFFNPYTYRRSV